MLLKWLSLVRHLRLSGEPRRKQAEFGALWRTSAEAALKGKPCLDVKHPKQNQQIAQVRDAGVVGSGCLKPVPGRLSHVHFRQLLCGCQEKVH